MYDIKLDGYNESKGKGTAGIGISFLLIILCTFFLARDISVLVRLDSKTTSYDMDVITEERRDDDGNYYEEYSPVYLYEVNDEKYSCPSNNYSRIHPINKKETIYYNSKNPKECASNINIINGIIIYSFLIIIFVIIFIFSNISITKINKLYKNIEILNNKGKLIKGLPFRVEYRKHLGKKYPIIVIDYKKRDGSVITLKSDIRVDGISKTKDNLADLVIDEDDNNIYFIDFDINRVSGNLPTDYYNNSLNNNNDPNKLVQVNINNIN